LDENNITSLHGERLGGIPESPIKLTIPRRSDRNYRGRRLANRTPNITIGALFGHQRSTFIAWKRAKFFLDECWLGNWAEGSKLNSFGITEKGLKQIGLVKTTIMIETLMRELLEISKRKVQLGKYCFREFTKEFSAYFLS